MAHELTHVINRDVMVMTLASFFATLASTIAQFALFFGGGYGNSEEEEDIMSWCSSRSLVYAVSFLLLRALSRYREFAADRGSAVLTGRPSALASALLKISGTIERVPSQDLRKAEGMSAFFIIPARTKKSLMNIFADHPPLEQRLAALERLESQLQSASLTVGLRDILTGRHEVKGPAPDRLFAISTAYIALQSEHEIDPAGTAAIVFQALATAEFEATLRDMEEVVKATGGDNGTTVSTEDDSFGYRWMVLRNPPARPASKTSRSGSTRCQARSRPPATASGCCAPCSPSSTHKNGRCTSSTTTSAASGTRSCPIRIPPPCECQSPLDRARAAAQGPDVLRTADRA